MTQEYGAFTVNGAPRLDISASMQFADMMSPGFTFSYSGSYSGDSTGRGDAGSGTCVMNLTFSMDSTNPHAVQMSGSICGYTV